MQPYALVFDGEHYRYAFRVSVDAPVWQRELSNLAGGGVNWWRIETRSAWAGVLQRHGYACYECEEHAYQHWQQEHYALSARSGIDDEGRRRFVAYDYELKTECDCDRFAYAEL